MPPLDPRVKVALLGTSPFQHTLVTAVEPARTRAQRGAAGGAVRPTAPPSGELWEAVQAEPGFTPTITDQSVSKYVGDLLTRVSQAEYATPPVAQSVTCTNPACLAENALGRQWCVQCKHYFKYVVWEWTPSDHTKKVATPIEMKKRQMQDLLEELQEVETEK